MTNTIDRDVNTKPSSSNRLTLIHFVVIAVCHNGVLYEGRDFEQFLTNPGQYYTSRAIPAP